MQAPDAGKLWSRRRLTLALLLTQSVVLVLIGGWCLRHAYLTQAALDRALIDSRLAPLLAERVARPHDGEALQKTVESLVDPRNIAGYGLRSLALLDADGQLLISRGVYASWGLNGGFGRTIESMLYRLSGAGGRLLIRSAGGKVLGSATYSFEVAAVRDARDDGIRRLHRAGRAILLLAVLALPIGLLLQRRNRRNDIDWRRRANPQPNGGAPDLIDTASALPQLHARAGTALDAMGYGFVTADREGRVRYINATAERLSGWTHAAAKGRMVYSIIHIVLENGEPMPNAAELALQSGSEAPPQQGWLRARDGARTPVELVTSVMRTGEHAIDGVVMLCRDVTQHVNEIAHLKRETRLSQAVVDHLEEGVLMTDPSGVVRFANARAERMFGYARDELQGFTVTKLMPVPFLNTPGIRITDYIAGGTQNPQRSTPLPKIVGWRKDATTFPVELWVQPLHVEHSSGLVVIIRDISERLRGENLASRLGRLLDAAVEEVYIFDAQSLMLLEVNRGARRNLGYRHEALLRMTPLDISEGLEPGVFRNYLLQLRGGDQDHVVYRSRHRRADGSTYPVEVRLNFSRDEEPPVFMAIATDIGERIAAEEKLEHLAHYDALTGLPNRVMLQDRLQQSWLTAQRGARLLGVLFLDLDRFKEINDTHGHEVGDLVLRAVADRLRSTMRPSDTVARLAGDEFVILAAGLRGVEDAARLAQKLLDRFAHPLDIPGHHLVCRPSIGVTLYPLDDAEPDGLMRHADEAMYEAKQAGRGCYRIFSTEIDDDRRRRLDLEREMHAAVALNQLHLIMSPVLDQGSGAAIAVLAHLYWQHPRFGRIEHDELLRAAARAGLIGDLELWQITHACEHHLAAGHHGVPQLPFIIEVSGWQLRGGEFPSHLSELLARYQVDSARLILALNADGLADAQILHPTAAQLLRQGVRLALRDFNLPLPSLESPPVALLLSTTDSDEMQIGAARNAAQEAGLPLIAAHVQHALQKNRWTAAGVHRLAGHAVQPAMDARQAISWLEGRAVDPL